MNLSRILSVWRLKKIKYITELPCRSIRCEKSRLLSLDLFGPGGEVPSPVDQVHVWSFGTRMGEFDSMRQEYLSFPWLFYLEDGLQSLPFRLLTICLWFWVKNTIKSEGVVWFSKTCLARFVYNNSPLNSGCSGILFTLNEDWKELSSNSENRFYLIYGFIYLTDVNNLLTHRSWWRGDTQ